MKSNLSSENHIINNLKAIINVENFFQSTISLKEIKKQDIIKFLDGKMKSPEIDPEKKWITTWNHYLSHLRFFFRWLYNENDKVNNDNDKYSKWSVFLQNIIEKGMKSTLCVQPKFHISDISVVVNFRI